MVGALDKIMSKLLQGNPQANFRLSAFRMGAQVDTKPTAATVKQLHQMLLAEVELAMGSNETHGKGQGSPAVKTLKDNKAGSPAQPVCHAASGSQIKDVDKEHNASSNIQRMKMANTTATLVAQRTTRNRIVPTTLRPRRTRATPRLELQKVLQPGGVVPVVVMEKALENRVEKATATRAKVEKPTEMTRRATQQDPKMIKRM